MRAVLFAIFFYAVLSNERESQGFFCLDFRALPSSEKYQRELVFLRMVEEFKVYTEQENSRYVFVFNLNTPLGARQDSGIVP
jgi:hypothetical protein